MGANMLWLKLQDWHLCSRSFLLKHKIEWIWDAKILQIFKRQMSNFVHSSAWTTVNGFLLENLKLKCKTPMWTVYLYIMSAHQQNLKNSFAAVVVFVVFHYCELTPTQIVFSFTCKWEFIQFNSIANPFNCEWINFTCSMLFFFSPLFRLWSARLILFFLVCFHFHQRKLCSWHI